jgi:hypothetical protein
LLIFEAGSVGGVSILADDPDARARLMKLYLLIQPDVVAFEGRVKARLAGVLPGIPSEPRRGGVVSTLPAMAARRRPGRMKPTPPADAVPGRGEEEAQPVPRGGEGS